MFERVMKMIKKLRALGKISNVHYNYLIRKFAREVKKEKNRLKKLLGPELIQEKERMAKILQNELDQEVRNIKRKSKPAVARLIKVISMKKPAKKKARKLKAK